MEDKDNYSYDGATKLARKIVRQWRRRGHNNVLAEVFKIEADVEGDRYGVKTNLVSGLPPSGAK